MNRLLTPTEVAELLGLNVKTLANLRSNGGAGPPYIKVGAMVRYDQAHLERWLRVRTHGGDGTVELEVEARVTSRRMRQAS